jgi:hypothetical protein
MKRNLKKNIAAFLVATFAYVACSVMPAYANEEKPSADFSLSALSAYIWRGQELSRDSIVVQPSMTVSYRGLSANLWGNLDTDPYAAQDDTKWTETDFTLSYGKGFGMLSVEGGYIYYGLDDCDDSQELFLTLSLDTLLSPGLTVYREFDNYEHWYFLLGISHSFEITEAVSLELSGSVSYLKSLDADAYPEIDSYAPTGDKLENFHDGVISASLPIAVAEYITITPSLSYTFALSSDASDEMEWRSAGFRAKTSGDANFLYGGVTVSMAF